MTNKDLYLYLVLDGAVCQSKENLLHTAKMALDNGITFLQLRGDKKRWTGRDWLTIAQELKLLCQAANVPFVINDKVDIALAVDADGVHIGQEDLPAQLVRQLLGEKKIIGLSTHSLAEVTAEAGKYVDYFGFGPVFPTTSKENPAPVIGLEMLAQMAAAAPVPGVAIGGVNAHNLAAVRATGVAGVAVISAICGQDDVAAATRALL